MDLQPIRKQLRLAMNGVIANSMRQKGMNYKLIFGVPWPEIKQIAASHTPDADLARALWQEDVREMKILATLLKEYSDAVFKPETYYARNLLSIMPEQYKVNQEDSIYTKIQTVTDYVSGMTDSYALNLYRKIKGIDLPEIR